MQEEENSEQQLSAELNNKFVRLTKKQQGPGNEQRNSRSTSIHTEGGN